MRDGERIRYAKEAAIALLRQLDDTDFAGVIAFDSQPYVLAHLQPLGEDRGELENRIDRLQPGGGTDFKDALEIAEREILQSGIPVRQVICRPTATPTASITITTILSPSSRASTSPSRPSASV